MSKAFSKIWIIVIVLVIMGTTTLAWQTCWAQEIEDKTAECSSIDFSNYEVARSNYGQPLEFYIHLNGDHKVEFVRIYKERDHEEDRTLPIMVKIFSGTKDCLKEEFSYIAERPSEKGERTLLPGKYLENEVYFAEVFPNFWGEGINAVLVEGISTAYGSGYSIRLHFFTWQNGKYVVVEGPQYGWSQGAPSGYMFASEKTKGTKIILAQPTWDREGDAYLGPHHYQFIIYNWNGDQYITTAGGITKNTYGWQWWEEDSKSFIQRVIHAEPEVLKPVEEGTEEIKTVK